MCAAAEQYRYAHPDKTTTNKRDHNILYCNVATGHTSPLFQSSNQRLSSSECYNSYSRRGQTQYGYSNHRQYNRGGGYRFEPRTNHGGYQSNRPQQRGGYTPYNQQPQQQRQQHFSAPQDRKRCSHCKGRFHVQQNCPFMLKPTSQLVC